MSPKRRQAIIGINDALVCWRIYALLGLNVYNGVAIYNSRLFSALFLGLPLMSEIKAWLSNHTPYFMWDVGLITFPCPNFNGCSAKSPLNLGYG